MVVLHIMPIALANSFVLASCLCCSFFHTSYYCGTFIFIFTAQCTLVHMRGVHCAVLGSHVVCLSICLSVCDVGDL